MYKLEAKPSQRRVELSFDGEMKQDPAKFFAEFSAAVNSVRGNGSSFDLLLDFSATHVMPQDRVQNTRRIFEWCLENGIGKAAFVMNGVTQRMQIRRVTERHEKVEFFDDCETAADWLSQ